ncbi:hypothetical protein [uncultured Methanomethylovorans sp.]|uniref:hypothetical protein n=1 Tax=uncultured Methanomethylovorans sp. TaxID=183759 RepID=UPI002AA6E21C|nr:hypothetical protein [uncultured Methanomethylovorans sp.]
MKYTTVCVLIMIVCAIVLSGCADKKDNASEISSSTISPVNDTSAADAVLANGNVSITDTEVLDMNQEMKELEALISEMEKEENITIEDL